MKKNLTMMAFVACAALTIVSCSNDEVTDSAVKQEQQAVTFGTYVGRGVQSRGTVMDDTALQTDNFGVMASYTKTANFASSDTPNFMFNQEVMYSGGAWTYSPVKYWPMENGARLSFFAYAPYSSNANVAVATTNTTAGYPSVNVTCPTDLKDMVDFVAAKKENVERGSGTTPDVVDFTFGHKMTRLELFAKVSKNVNASSNKTSVFIREVKLDAGDGTEDNLYSAGKYLFETDTWDFSNATKVNDMSLSSILDLQTASFGAVVGQEYSQQSIEVESSAVRLFPTDQYLFLVPSTKDGDSETGLTGGNAYAAITYDIVTADASLAKGYSISTHTKKVFLPTSSSLTTPSGTGILKQGVAYKLTFNIALEEVKVEASVTPWSTAVGVDPESNVTHSEQDL